MRTHRGEQRKGEGTVRQCESCPVERAQTATSVSLSVTGLTTSRLPLPLCQSTQSSASTLSSQGGG